MKRGLIVALVLMIILGNVAFVYAQEGSTSTLQTTEGTLYLKDQSGTVSPFQWFTDKLVGIRDKLIETMPVLGTIRDNVNSLLDKYIFRKKSPGVSTDYGPGFVGDVKFGGTTLDKGAYSWQVIMTFNQNGVPLESTPSFDANGIPEVGQPVRVEVSGSSGLLPKKLYPNCAFTKDVTGKDVRGYCKQACFYPNPDDCLVNDCRLTFEKEDVAIECSPRTEGAPVANRQLSKDCIANKCLWTDKIAKCEKENAAYAECTKGVRESPNAYTQFCPGDPNCDPYAHCKPSSDTAIECQKEVEKRCYGCPLWEVRCKGEGIATYHVGTGDYESAEGEIDCQMKVIDMGGGVPAETVKGLEENLIHGTWSANIRGSAKKVGLCKDYPLPDYDPNPTYESLMSSSICPAGSQNDEGTLGYDRNNLPWTNVVVKPTTPEENKTAEKKPSCTDGIKNQDETGVDCGGSICDTCKIIFAKKDYTDGKKNPAETDVDCGGLNPSKCGLYDGCKSNADCSTGICLNGACRATPNNKKLLSFVCESVGAKTTCHRGPAVVGFIPPSFILNGKKYGGYALEFAWNEMTLELQSGDGGLGESVGGVSAVIYAGADAAFSPSTIENVYKVTKNPKVNASTNDSSINVSTENKVVDGKNVTVVNIKTDKKASGNKTITVTLIGEDENGTSVDIGTMEVNANIMPAPKSSFQKGVIISSIVLGALAIMGFLVKLYLKESVLEEAV